MKCSLVLPVLLGVACAPTPAVDPEPPIDTSASVQEAEDSPPTVSDPQPVASDEPRLELELNHPRPVGDEDGVEVEVTNLSIELLAPEADSYVTVFETVAQVEFRISIGDHSETIETRIWTTEQGPWRLPVAVWGQLARITVLEVPYVDQQPNIVVSVARYGEAAETTKLRLEKGQRVALADIELELRGHGHKTVMAGGSSPLMVALDYHVPGQAPPERQNLSLQDPMHWSWRNYSFVAEDYEYGVSMQVSVARRKLIPLAPR